MIEVSAFHPMGDFTLDVRFSSPARVTALFGVSGAGKSSIINVIAGLTRPQQARVVVDGAVLCDTQARLFVPPHKRRVACVFQDARLFPHLTVAQNLRFGRWFTPANERYTSFDAVVEMLGIGHLLARFPQGLSGGERQRVALGRALLQSPRLLLLDEPLAALDEARKQEVLPYLERLRDEMQVPMLYVSHSMAEVQRLAECVVQVEGGRTFSAP